MSASDAAPAATPNDASAHPAADKGKGKAADIVQDNHTDADEDDDDDDEEDEDESMDVDDDDEDDDEDDDDAAEKLDASAILPPGTRRSARAQVDYTSKEALEKAGIAADADDDEDEFVDANTSKDD